MVPDESCVTSTTSSIFSACLSKFVDLISLMTLGMFLVVLSSDCFIESRASSSGRSSESDPLPVGTHMHILFSTAPSTCSLS